MSSANWSGRLLPADRLDERLHLGDGKAAQEDAFVEPFSAQRRDRLGEWMRALELDVAVGPDDQETRAADPAGEVHEQQQRRLVGPVHVVEDDHERSDAGRRDEERAHTLEEAVTFRVAVEGREHRELREPVAQLGDDRRDLGAAGVGIEQVAVVGELAHEGAQRLDEREVRHADVAFVRVPPQHLRATDRCVHAELLDRAGLADAGFTDDHDDARLARERLVERGAQRVELGRPPDEPAPIREPRRRTGLRDGSSGTAATGVDSSAVCAAPRSSSTSAAFAGRAAGSFSRSRSTSVSTAIGTSLLWNRGATGGVLRCWLMTETMSSPRNGGRPHSIS